MKLNYFQDIERLKVKIQALPKSPNLEEFFANNAAGQRILY